MHEYKTRLRWIGAAVGPTAGYEAYSREHVIEMEGKAPLRGSADPAFRGDPRLYNPEELLVASLSACHMLSYLAEAARAGLAVVQYEDSAVGRMRLEGQGGRFVEVLLRPKVTIAAGGHAGEAAALHERAHANCYIASSVNFPVRHAAEIVVAGAP